MVYMENRRTRGYEAMCACRGRFNGGVGEAQKTTYRLLGNNGDPLSPSFLLVKEGRRIE
jgi:hypothetical protein